MLLNLLAHKLGRRLGIPSVVIIGAIALFNSGALGGLFSNNASSGIFGDENSPSIIDSSSSFEHCSTAEDANSYDDCRVLATAVSLDSVWSELLPNEENLTYQRPQLVLAEGQVQSACGRSNISQGGPFYCPSDHTVYMSTPFFQQLKNMGGSDGPFAQMYVTAHEFGHHIQQLMGTLSHSDYSNPGADSGAVQVELQADCYAGVWASRADKGSEAILDPITQKQVQQAIATAQSIGDDAIQRSAGQDVNPDAWTHGSSEQREKWFLQGYQGGKVQSCQQSFNR